MDLDHVFVLARDPRWSSARAAGCASDSAAIADRWARAIVSAGFAEGKGRRHPGQGTANRSFFFERFMLEILFIENARDLARPANALLALDRRFLGEVSSPFGFGFRPSDTSELTLAFQHQAYRPGYLPADMQIDVATEPTIQDPLLFHLPFLTPFDRPATPMAKAKAIAGPESGSVGAGGTGEQAEHFTNAATTLIGARLWQPSAPHVATHTALSVARTTVAPGERHRLSLHFEQRSGAISNNAERRVALPVALPGDCPLDITIRTAT